MLIRISGYRNGAPFYFRFGNKSGRDYTRNQLDDRLILDGDLDITDELINSLDLEGEQYLTITMSFKEDFVPEETLWAINEEWKAFAFSAYEPDEYNYYSEGHLPRMKSIINKQGKEEIRKPHTHGLIANQNLVSGTGLNPFGKVSQQIKYLKAWQTSINAKYGLASPDDNRRAISKGGDGAIAQYTPGDVFAGGRRDLKTAILNRMLERDVESKESFEQMLGEFGTVKVRNAGKPNAHFYVKPGQGEGINLRDHAFSDAFIAMPTAAKRQWLAAQGGKEYIEPGTPRAVPADVTATLDEWHSIRAKEVRYINSGNKSFYRKYKAANRTERLAILEDQAVSFNKKYRQGATHERGSRKHHASKVGRTPPPSRRGHLQNLSECGVVQLADRGQVLLPSDVPRVLVEQGAERDHDVRRLADRERDSRRVKGDDYVSQLIRNEVKADLAQTVEASPAHAWRKELRADFLLDYLAGADVRLVLEKYEIVKAKDSTDRIRCGTRNLTVSNFMTEELRFDWATAEQILKAAFQSQINDARQDRQEEPAQALYRAFTTWQATTWDTENKAVSTAQRKAQAERMHAIKDAFYRARSAIYADPTHSTHAQRRAATSLLRMQRIEYESVERHRREEERQFLKEKMNMKPADLFRHFLHQEATTGNAAALAELRRQRALPAALSANTPAFLPAPEIEAIHTPDLVTTVKITHTVDSNGHVTYSRNGEAFMRDEVRAVVVLQDEDASIEHALRLAITKFGPDITINGTDEFKERVKRIVAEKKLDVTFKQPLPKLTAAAPIAASPAIPANATTAKQKAPPPKVLLEHGAAPYQFQDTNPINYYAKLRNQDGTVSTVWGVDIERSLAEADAKRGDKLLLTSGAKAKVTIKVKSLDGKQVEKIVERVTWHTSIAERIEDVNERQKSPENASEPTPETVNKGGAAAPENAMKSDMQAWMARQAEDAARNRREREIAEEKARVAAAASRNTKDNGPETPSI